MLVSLFIIVAPLTFFLLFIRKRSGRLYALSKSASTPTILSYSPNNLTTSDLATSILNILFKYIPGQSPRLQIQNNGYLLPRLHLSGLLAISSKDHEIFQHALAKRTDAPSEPTNPLFLISLTTPLLVLLLSHPSCPIKPFGAVNTRNVITFSNAPLCRSATRLIAASKKSELTFTAAMGGSDLPGRRKRRGVEFDIVVEVWQKGSPVLSAHCSFLQFLSKATKPLYVGEAEMRAEPLQLIQGPVVSIDAGAPRRWARCSKDYNPIHVYSLVAKIFGFPGVIAHGNHVVALMAEAILASESEGVEVQEMKSLLWAHNRSFVVEASFVKPITPLALKLDAGLRNMAKDAQQNGVQFELSKKTRPFIVGSVY